MSHPFHALQKTPEDLRSTADVFSSVAKDADRIGSRFSSGGKFTEQQFKAGEDATEPQVEDGEVQAEGEAEDGAPVYDPNDRRSLYDRLKEQKDAKQEEWEEQHKFKNQMDHWKLDVDDAAFEEERMDRLAAQRAEAERLRQESSQFYRLAREARTTPAARVVPTRPPIAQQAKPQPSKRSLNALPTVLRVVKSKASSATPSATAVAAVRIPREAAAADAKASHAPAVSCEAPCTATPAAALEAAGTSLLGLAYGSSDEDDGALVRDL